MTEMIVANVKLGTEVRTQLWPAESREVMEKHYADSLKWGLIDVWWEKK